MCFIAFLLVLILPIDYFQRPARFALIQSFFNCIRAPFVKVTFRDFFFADVLCSATVSFADFCSFSCLAGAKDFKNVRHG